MPLLAIDPGLDVVAGAVFDTDTAASRSLDTAIRRLTHFVDGKTSPRDPLPVRCAEISAWVGATVKALDIDRIVVETPPVWHAARQKGRIPPAGVLASIGKLHAAIGALYGGAGLAGVPVVEGPTPTNSKDARSTIVNRLLHSSGRAEIRNADRIDAIWTGLLALTTEP